MKYHLFKQTRVYFGEPYIGPSSDYVPMETDDLGVARRMRNKLYERNPAVGWNIWDSESRTLVEGDDHFEEL